MPSAVSPLSIASASAASVNAAVPPPKPIDPSSPSDFQSELSKASDRSSSSQPATDSSSNPDQSSDADATPGHSIKADGSKDAGKTTGKKATGRAKKAKSAKATKTDHANPDEDEEEVDATDAAAKQTADADPTAGLPQILQEAGKADTETAAATKQVEDSGEAETEDHAANGPVAKKAATAKSLPLADEEDSDPADSAAKSTGSKKPAIADASKPNQPQAVKAPTTAAANGNAAVAPVKNATDDSGKKHQTANNSDDATQAVASATASASDAATPAATTPAAPATSAATANAVAPLPVDLGEDAAPLAAQPGDVAVKASAPKAAAPAATDATDSESADDFAAALSDAESAVASVKTTVKDLVADAATALTATTAHTPTPAGNATTTTAAATPNAPAEVRFAEANHETIVAGVHAQLLPHGGTMQMRLDPPELGSLQITLSVKNGIASASFETSNEDATRVLSHSLTQLKSALENAGIAVDKLQVHQAPKDSNSGGSTDKQGSQGSQDSMGRQQEQQRKDMIKKMWAKLSGVEDPLDMVA